MRIDELKGSWEKLGELYPVLVDKNGNVIDGKHRKKANPNWYEKVIDTDDPVRIAMIDFIANVNRREISNSEIKKKLDKIAELTGWSVQQIAVEIGRSGEAGEKWVRRYISERYKDTAQVERAKKQSAGSSADILSAEESGDARKAETETPEVLEVPHSPCKYPPFRLYRPH